MRFCPRTLGGHLQHALAEFDGSAGSEDQLERRGAFPAAWNTRSPLQYDYISNRRMFCVHSSACIRNTWMSYTNVLLPVYPWLGLSDYLYMIPVIHPSTARETKPIHPTPVHDNNDRAGFYSEL
jgi:hypothetical protein